MKSYTDIEQSKKLIELGIDTSSADMCYDVGTGEEKAHIECDNFISYFTNDEYPEMADRYIPCWSLAALFRVLPVYIDGSRLRMDISVNDFNLWFENLSSGIADENLPDITKENPVDACYEMILKLHEQKML